MNSTETAGYVLNHTMLRVRDPKESLNFYESVLGMKLIRKLDFEEWKFSLYFLAYLGEEEKIPTDPKENSMFTFGRSAVLELTHNWGTEAQPETPYHNGNAEPRGFGHICVSVPDIQKACKRFEDLKVPFRRNSGKGA